MNYLYNLYFSIIELIKFWLKFLKKQVKSTRQPQKQLIKGKRTLEVLSSLSYRTGELSDYLQLIANSVSELLSVDWVAVTLCRDGFERVLASSIGGNDPDQLLNLHGTLTGSVINAGCCLFVEDTRTNSKYGQPPDGYLAYIGSPLKIPTGEIIGTVCAFYHHPRKFSVEDMKLVEIFAERAATAIDNYNLYQAQQEMNKALQLKIRDCQEVELSLRNSEEQLRQIAENLKPVVWMYSRNHEPIYISPMFEKVWGIPTEQWYHDGAICLKAVHPEDRDFVSLAFTNVFTADTTYDLEYRIIRPDGEIRIIHDQAFPIVDETGSIYRVAGIAEDITERQQEQQRTIKAMERLSEIGELATRIVHEVRNPLTTVLMGLNYFERMELSENAQKRLTLALDEAERLKRLLNEILTYARHEVIQPEPLDLNQLTLNLVNNTSNSQLAIGKYISFMPLSQPLVIVADMNKLKQVIINLLQNACEAVTENGKILVKIMALTDSYQVCLQIENNGAPIPSEVLPKLTKPFFTTKPSGTGLGLAIVKKIVEAHDGKLEIESSAINGTVVRVILPLNLKE
ncbi:PAS domain S-box [Synechococcus sp. PCC 7502]|uniref:GAF domain-containing sensor histidine kinase n=1 Tax=Synechococcus sp. PCC 7502 TaxID=1173263 RepID=UPI00029FC90D|nr:GAF domain-containing sensor histidine kinase [Synechococcus sp. PCC 7502]AFY75101.1 PAS domain S-box [Synechococcus sp. PCC 7502]